MGSTYDENHFMKTHLFGLILAMFCASSLHAQMTISSENQLEIITKLSEEIKTRYFDARIAEMIADSLADISTQLTQDIRVVEFCDRVNALLHAISNDNHLTIYQDKDMFLSYSTGEDAKKEYEYETQRKINFGFTKVEILDGNIGYINIMRCSSFIGEVVAQKIASAMNLVENTNALIIDLRYNMGGDGRVAEILETYFYPEENLVIFDSTTQSHRFKVLPFVIGKRYLNRPVYVLTGLSTFSAGEAIAGGLQSGKKAIVVGVKTKGGGNPGRSVPLVYDFLSFIPTSAGVTDEKASVKPDILSSQDDALHYAKRHYFQGKLKQVTSDGEKEIIDWNLKTIEYLLGSYPKNLPLDKNICGKYENERNVYSKGGKVYIQIKDKEHEMLQIDSNEFVVLGFEDAFGKGNRRIIFSKGQLEDYILIGGGIMKKVMKKL